MRQREEKIRQEIIKNSSQYSSPYRLRVRRAPGEEKAGTFVGVIYGSEFVVYYDFIEEALQQKFGGGKYRVQVYKNKKPYERPMYFQIAAG